MATVDGREVTIPDAARAFRAGSTDIQRKPLWPLDACRATFDLRLANLRCPRRRRGRPSARRRTAELLLLSASAAVRASTQQPATAARVMDMLDDKMPRASPGLQRWKAAGSQVLTLADMKNKLSPRPPPGARPEATRPRLGDLAGTKPTDDDARSDAESYGSNKPKRRSREISRDSPANRDSSGSGEPSRAESPASATLAYYKGWAVEGLDDLAKLGGATRKKRSSSQRHGHRKPASPLAGGGGGGVGLNNASPQSPLGGGGGFSGGSSPACARPDSPRASCVGGIGVGTGGGSGVVGGGGGGAGVISTLSGSVLSTLNSGNSSYRSADYNDDDSASIASGGSYAPSIALSTASRGSIGSSYSRMSNSLPRSPDGRRGGGGGGMGKREGSGAAASLAAQHRRRQREMNSNASEVGGGGGRRRGSIRRGGAPVLQEATQEEEKAAASSQNVTDHQRGSYTQCQPPSVRCNATL